MMNQQYSPFPPPPQSERVTTRTAGDTAAVAPPAATSPTPGGSRLVVIVAAVVALVVVLTAVGIGGWLAIRTATTATTPTTVPSATPALAEPASTIPPLPTSPTLRYSYQVATGDDFGAEPDFAGTADDLFVAEAGEATGGEATTVTRYVDGQAAWVTNVGLSSSPFIVYADGLVLVRSQGPEYGDDSNLVGLNPDDGSIIWSMMAPPRSWPRVDDGRLFVLEGAQTSDDTDELVEYDPEIGAELNRVGDAFFQSIDGGFVAIDPIEQTAQLLNLDLEPVGPAVDIGTSGSDFEPYIVTHLADGWLYYADRTLFGGSRSVTALMPDGTLRFECPVTISDPYRVFMLGPTTVAASSYRGIEVTDIDGDECHTRWIVSVQEPRNVGATAWHPFIFTYEADDGEIDIDGGPSTIEVLDWQSGDTIATGERSVNLYSGGSIVTFSGNSLVASDIATGQERWRIDGVTRGDLTDLPGGIVVTSATDDSLTIDIYGD